MGTHSRWSVRSFIVEITFLLFDDLLTFSNHFRLVSVARGEQLFFDPAGLPTATEGCKSNALMRCCKDLGIASELWFALSSLTHPFDCTDRMIITIGTLGSSECSNRNIVLKLGLSMLRRRKGS